MMGRHDERGKVGGEVRRPDVGCVLAAAWCGGRAGFGTRTKRRGIRSTERGRTRTDPYLVGHRLGGHREAASHPAS